MEIEWSDVLSMFNPELDQALKELQKTDYIRRWVEIGLAVKDLLVAHVLNEDTKYIEYLRTQ